MAMSPSSRFGMNSVPRRVASQPHSNVSTRRADDHGQRQAQGESQAPADRRTCAALITTLCFSGRGLRNRNATPAGTNVSDSSIALSSAMITVIAIG